MLFNEQGLFARRFSDFNAAPRFAPLSMAMMSHGHPTKQAFACLP